MNDKTSIIFATTVVSSFNLCRKTTGFIKHTDEDLGFYCFPAFSVLFHRSFRELLGDTTSERLKEKTLLPSHHQTRHADPAQTRADVVPHSDAPTSDLLTHRQLQEEERDADDEEEDEVRN